MASLGRQLAVLAALLGSMVSAAPPAHAQTDGSLRVEASVLRDENVNRARDADDTLKDSIYSVNVAASAVVPLAEHARLVASGFAGGDKFDRYSGLDRLWGGSQGEIQYRASGEYFTPTFGLFVRIAFDVVSGQLRSGHRESLGVTYRQPLSDRINLFAALAASTRNADNKVFDARDAAARFNLDYDLGWRGTLYAGGEYRRGDVVTTLPSSPEYASIAKFRVQDDAYGGDPRFAYRFEAKTVLWTLGYNLPLGPRDSLDFFARRARSTLANPPTGIYANSSPYIANQYSLAYLKRF